MSGDEVVARTGSGVLRGVRHRGVAQFRRVPYAAAPVGPLRFAPPRPAAPWGGVRDAGRHGPIAPQAPGRLRHVMGDYRRPQSEDCLTLTVSTPAADGGSRPVAVFLHGGAYMSGAGSLDWYDGARLAAEGDLVVVAPNYRLGLLGYLCHPRLGDGAAGVQDVLGALGWVREHARAFGGDPGRVTLIGQSAGAGMIALMLAAAEARGLFRRAVLHSFPGGAAPLRTSAAQRRVAMVLDSLGIDSADAEALREVPAERLLAAAGQLARATAGPDAIPPVLPVMDALASPDRWVDAAAAGAVAGGVELIVGTTRDEMHAFLVDPDRPDPDPAAMAALLEKMAGGAEAAAGYRRRRPGAPPHHLLADALTDRTLAAPSRRLAEATAAAGVPTWRFRFDWAPPGSPLGACHCIDLPFLFGNFDDWPGAAMLRGADPAQVRELSAIMRRAWISFVRDGEPDPGVPWPRYDAEGRGALVLGPKVEPAGASWAG